MTPVIQNHNTPSLEWGESKTQLLKDTFCKGSSNNEFELFLHACKKSGLDPFMKQIHAVKRWDSSLNKEAMTIQTGIDGYRLIAERTGRYVPGRESTYNYDCDGKLVSATAYVKKQTADGTWHEVSATAFFEEYVQRKKNGEPTSFWMKMPHAQLAKCAEALALRKAFPNDLSGIYTHEEMAQAEREEASVTILPPQVETEISQEEIDMYISKKSEDLLETPEMFKAFMDYIKEPRKWTYRKCMESFEKNVDYTAESFAKWKGSLEQSA